MVVMRSSELVGPCRRGWRATSWRRDGPERNRSRRAPDSAECWSKQSTPSDVWLSGRHWSHHSAPTANVRPSWDMCTATGGSEQFSYPFAGHGASCSRGLTQQRASNCPCCCPPSSMRSSELSAPYRGGSTATLLVSARPAVMVCGVASVGESSLLLPTLHALVPIRAPPRLRPSLP